MSVLQSARIPRPAAWSAYGSPVRIEAETAVRRLGGDRPGIRLPMLDGYLRGRHGELPARDLEPGAANAHYRGWSAGHSVLLEETGPEALARIRKTAQALAKRLDITDSAAMRQFIDGYVHGRIGALKDGFNPKSIVSFDSPEDEAYKDGWTYGRFDWRCDRDNLLADRYGRIAFPGDASVPLVAVPYRYIGKAREPYWLHDRTRFDFNSGYEARWIGKLPAPDSEEAYHGWRIADQDIARIGIDYVDRAKRARSPEQVYSLYCNLQKDDRLTPIQRRLIAGPIAQILESAIEAGRWEPPVEEFRRALQHLLVRNDFAPEIMAMRDNGASEEDLLTYLDRVFGLGGGSSGGLEHLSLNYKGGRHPYLSLGGFRNNRLPTIKGKAFLKEVRVVLNVPTPEEAQGRPLAMRRAVERRNLVRQRAREYIRNLPIPALNGVAHRDFLVGVEIALAGREIVALAKKNERWQVAGWAWARKQLRRPRTSRNSQDQLDLFAA